MDTVKVPVTFTGGGPLDGEVLLLKPDTLAYKIPLAQAPPIAMGKDQTEIVIPELRAQAYERQTYNNGSVVQMVYVGEVSV